jgi:hypothetical protein
LPGRAGSATRVSSFCTGGACVGVVDGGETVEVVDTKNVGGARLRFTSDEWTAFLAGVKAGEFDLD